MKRAYIFIVLATLMFSSMEVALKGVTGHLNPVQVTATRFLIGGLALIPFALHSLRTHGQHLDVKSLAELAGLGFIGVVVSMTLYQLAVEYAPASVVAVLISCNPVFVVPLAYLLLHTRIRRQDILALVFECFGIVLLIAPWNIHLSLAGVTFGILSALFFALYGVLGKPICTHYSGIVVTSGNFLFASVEMLCLCALTHIPAAAEWLTAHNLSLFAAVPLCSGYDSPEIIWTMVYACFAVTGIGYASYFLAIEYSTPVLASLIFFFKPVLAPILAWLILSEPIPLNMIFGIVLILLGSLAAMLPSPEVLRVTLRNGHWGWKHGH